MTVERDVSHRLDHAIEEGIGQFTGRDRVRDTRTYTWDQPQDPWSCRGDIGIHERRIEPP